MFIKLVYSNYGDDQDDLEVPELIFHYKGSEASISRVRALLDAKFNSWREYARASISLYRKNSEDFQIQNENKYFSTEKLLKLLDINKDEARAWHNSEKVRYNNDLNDYLNTKKIPVDFLNFEEYMVNDEDFEIIQIHELEVC